MAMARQITTRTTIAAAPVARVQMRAGRRSLTVVVSPRRAASNPPTPPGRHRSRAAANARRGPDLPSGSAS